MAIYSLHVKMVLAAPVAALLRPLRIVPAKRSRDDRLGVVWDFTAKRGVLHSEIIAPEDAPEWVQDRAELWNAAERAEDKSTRREQAATGRDIILALPHELTHEQRVESVREFATCAHTALWRRR